MHSNDDGEEPSEREGGRSGALDRARNVIGSARRQASRSAEVLSGADIRRFDELTDATTRAVVGVHQDQEELREQLARTDQTLDEVRQRQAQLGEQLEGLEQSVGRVLRGQDALSARVEQSTHSHSSGVTGLSPWMIAIGFAAVALLSSIAAIVVSLF